MQAELRGMVSPTLPLGPDGVLDNPCDCWVVMTAEIGCEGEPGADCFVFYVTTPAFLQRTLGAGPYQLERGRVIVERFDWKAIENLVRQICSNVRGESWDVIVELLSRHFLWEFEDYRL